LDKQKPEYRTQRDVPHCDRQGQSQSGNDRLWSLRHEVGRRRRHEKKKNQKSTAIVIDPSQLFGLRFALFLADELTVPT